jgi:predicted metal-binding membrane protein
MDEPGTKNMGTGFVWFIGGSLFTFLTYLVAQGSGGGIYVVTYGAIIVGAVQFLAGLFQYLKFKSGK